MVEEEGISQKSAPPPLTDTSPMTATGIVHCYTASDMMGGHSSSHLPRVSHRQRVKKRPTKRIRSRGEKERGMLGNNLSRVRQRDGNTVPPRAQASPNPSSGARDCTPYPAEQTDHALLPPAPPPVPVPVPRSPVWKPKRSWPQCAQYRHIGGCRSFSLAPYQRKTGTGVVQPVARPCLSRSPASWMLW